MIDLQIHTTDSDGTWPWAKALDYCVQIGLKAFAITDHDTLVRHGEIKKWALENKANAIPGIEISTSDKGQSVHLLGYFLDGPLQKLEEKLMILRQGRDVRNTKIIEELNRRGIPITEYQVKKVAGHGTVGRPHIARALLEGGFVESIKEAFDKYLALEGAAYFPKEEIDLREAIDLLHEAGAVTSVAHPMLLKRSSASLEELFKEWRGWGLDGLESIYPIYTTSQINFMSRMTEKYGFLKTGGSDFHGENKPHIKIGVGTGQLNVPDEFLEPLYARREEISKFVQAPK